MIQLFLSLVAEARRRSLIGLALACAAAVLGGCGGSDDADPLPPPAQSVTGTASVAGQPVRSGRVMLSSAAGATVAQATTDDAGRFSFTLAPDALVDEMWLAVSGGQVEGSDLQATLRAFHRKDNAGAADVTAMTALVAQLADAQAETTPAARHDAALARMTTLGALTRSDWAAPEPSTVDTAALRAQLAESGLQPWLQATASEFGAAGEVGARLVLVFPRVQGGIFGLSLGGSGPVPMLRGFLSTAQVAVEAHAPPADYDFRITRGPAGASVDSQGVLSYLPPETGSAVNEPVAVTVTRRSTGLGRTVSASIEVLPVETVLEGQVGAEGGTLMNDWQDMVLTVPPGAVPAGTTLRVMRALSARGVQTYALKSSANMSLPARLATPRGSPGLAPSATGTASSKRENRRRALATDPVTMTLRAAWEGSYLKFGAGTYRYNRLKSGQDCQVWAPNPDVGSVTCDKTEVTSALHSYCAANECVGKVPVIFIHGFLASGLTSNFPELGGGAGTWGSFREKLWQAGYAVYEFRWRTNANFKDIAAQLEQAVKVARADTRQPVHLLAHSFGGLVARAYLQGLAGYGDVAYTPDDVASLITIGTPHSGIADSTTTFNGVEFPGGQDAALFEGCLQISCHLSGEATQGSFVEGGVSFHRDFGLSDPPPGEEFTPPGELPFELFDRVQRFPVNILALYSLQTEEELFGSEVFFTGGDGLISFSGQRFLPNLQLRATTADPVPLDGDGSKTFHEVILGNDPGTLPGKLVPLSSLGDGFFAHSCATHFPYDCGGDRRAQPYIDKDDHPSLEKVKQWLENYPAVAPDRPPQTVEVTARVVDARTKAAVPGAMVQVQYAHIERARTTAALDGTLRLTVNFYADKQFDILVTAPGYRNGDYPAKLEFGGSVTGTGVFLGDLEIAPDQLLASSVSGQVTDALSGQALSGVSVSLRSPQLVRGLLADAAGQFRFDGLVPGTYTLELRRDGYIDQVREFTITEPINQLANIGMSPRLAAGQTRIRLAWGAEPRDLDSHLRRYTDGRQDYVVYFASKRGVDAQLDLDDTNGYGPETITISPTSATSSYRYVVHRYAGSGSIATSSAVVTVNTDSLARDFRPPNEPGNYWHVFDVIGGRIVPCQQGCMSDSWPQPLGAQQLPPQARLSAMPRKLPGPLAQ